MGWTSEMVAQTYSISREKQDHYAYISHSRAEKVAVLATTILMVLPNHPYLSDDTPRPLKSVNSLRRLFRSK